ncbi:hypothetical protein Dxin01_03353 [Deinococcus xinjiangensis]|uniref:RES domain-containing protein n=1 Tax=Deinococcus xinjiangensis TaxID=457454 RepID=A0ABP9VEC6_9DEIO
MLSGKALQAAIVAAPTVGLQGVQYQATSLACFQMPERTPGAWYSHQRFTPAGLSHALYLSDSMNVALSETALTFRSVFQHQDIPAHVVYPVYVQATRLLDLTDMGIRALLGVSLLTLTSDWRGAVTLSRQNPAYRVETHDLGYAAFEAGLEGIRYPSAFDPSRANSVLFTENLAEPVRLSMPDEGGSL